MGGLAVSNLGLGGCQFAAEHFLQSLGETSLQTTYRVEYVVMRYDGEDVGALINIITERQDISQSAHATAVKAIVQLT